MSLWCMWKLQTHMHNASIYKLCPGLMARRLAKIAHVLTRSNQFGYKEGISTIDAIRKIARYIVHANRDAGALRMGLSKAFDTINRAPLWMTLRKKGLRIEKIKHRRRGHQETQLSPKYAGKYGEQSENDIGGISMIRHQCASIHNIHGRRDGRQ